MIASPLLLLAFAAPDFDADVRPVLQRRCLACHRTGGMAPMAFDTWQQARPWARAMREQVLRRKMPPWGQSAGARMANDPGMTDEERKTIFLWAENGAPGKPGPAPPPASFSWRIGAPDFIATQPAPFELPARGDLDYQYFLFPVSEARERWVSAVEVVPGDRRAVHHAVVYVRERGSTWLPGIRAGEAYVPRGATVEERRAAGFTTADILAVYAPGQPPFSAPPGMAKRLPAGADLVLQIHYNTYGQPARDQTRAGLKFAAAPPEKAIYTLQLNRTDFAIPPGERRHRVTVAGTLPNDALLLSLFPHLHLRGAAFEYVIDHGEGRMETLLRVDPYDYFWQLNYLLAVPRALPKGTRLRATAWYDNSPNNPYNPDPAVTVTYGEQARQEMFAGFFDVAVDRSFDKTRYFQR